MPKKPLSITLDEANLLWLKGRAAGRKKRSLSDAIDEILTEARQGGYGSDEARSVVGTIDIALDDPDLERADAAVWALFEESASRPFLVREASPEYAVPAKTSSSKKSKRG